MQFSLMTNYDFKTRSQVHTARKLWHSVGVLMIIIIYHNVNRSTALQLMSLATALFVIMDLLRQQLPQLNKLLITVFHPIMRDHEKINLAGTTYLLLGSLVIMILFPQSIVILSLLFLGFADPIASYVGILYGKDKILGNKSLQGTFAAFVCCSVIATLYYFFHNMMTERLLVVGVISGLIGALAELIPIGKIDDNFSFPIVSASCLWGLFYLFGGF